MMIHILESKTRRVEEKIKEKVGKKEVETSRWVEEKYDEPQEFEVHPYELASSVATRYAALTRKPQPPPGLTPTLRDMEGRLIHPSRTMKQVFTEGPFYIAACEPWSLRGEAA